MKQLVWRYQWLLFVRNNISLIGHCSSEHNSYICIRICIFEKYYKNSYNVKLDVRDGSQLKGIICVWCLWLIWCEFGWVRKIMRGVGVWCIHKTTESKKTSHLPVNFCSQVRKFVQKIWSDTQSQRTHWVPVTEGVTSRMTHRTKSATYMNSYKSVGWNSKKYLSLKKWRLPPRPQVWRNL